jgi:hypothetical protein
VKILFDLKVRTDSGKAKGADALLKFYGLALVKSLNMLIFG